MRISTHYYVLSLGTSRNALFEAFRDSLIDVENQGFPVLGPAGRAATLDRDGMRELSRAVDRRFGRYYASEPLRLVVVGVPEMQAAFGSVTAHAAAVIGRIEGDHTATSARDLGEIVWPVVKVAMSGLVDRALRDLADCTGRGHLAAGLDAVARFAGQEEEATLLVEDGYHLRGSIRGTDGPLAVTPDLDVRESIDDVVDAVIERVLGSAGKVVFMPSGTLRDRNRIVLLRRSGGSES